MDINILKILVTSNRRISIALEVLCGARAAEYGPPHLPFDEKTAWAIATIGLTDAEKGEVRERWQRMLQIATNLKNLKP